MWQQRAGQTASLLRGAAAFWIGAGLVCLAVWLTAHYFSLNSNIEALQQSNTQRLEYFRISLENTLEKYEYLPFILTLQRDVKQLLKNPKDAAAQTDLNVYLQLMQEQARVAAIYLLDEQGTAVATSNFREGGSFMGQNYSFRPYFKDAMGGRPGKFYAVGATTGEPGYFLSSPLFDGKRPIGVAVVKVSLNEIEEAWSQSGDNLALSDANGVVFLSSVPKWRYHTLAPLAAATRDELKRTRQYGPHVLEPIMAQAIVPPTQGQRMEMELPDRQNGAAGPDQRRDTLVQARSVGRLGWRLVLFSDLESAHVAARNVALASVLAAAFLLLLYFYLRLRERRRRDLAAARAELQKANDDLERRIGARTQDLVIANSRLQSKVSELHEAQELLTETQNDLVQAGKLAILGQMAAGVTHELNQPLTAMRTLSDNTIVLMKQNQPRAAEDNLQSIAQLTDRMGRIVGQLKAFSRKSSERLLRVCVGKSLDDALALVEARARQAGVKIFYSGENRERCVLGDDVRLEQVFVNLLRNAIDAMAASPEPVLTLAVEQGEGRVIINVGDNGPGLSREALNHLFEPFYTSKPAGEGLGLGLTISLVIVRAMGGELNVRNRPEGGAVFSVSLPEYSERDHD